MQFTVQRVKGIGVMGKDRLVFEIKMRILAKDAKAVHDYFMECTDILGGRHWNYELNEGLVTLECNTTCNHFAIMRVVNHLLTYDKESVF